MTPDRWRHIKQLFDTALELDEPARSDWLDHECREDTALRQEVASLLAAHEGPPGAIDAPAKDRAGLNELRLVDVLKEQQALLAIRKRAREPADEG